MGLPATTTDDGPTSATTPSVHDEELAGALRLAGLRVTSQRLVLHRILREGDRHLTAEELLREAAGRLPGLSLPTVYATLDLFAGLGLVRRVPAPGGPAIFDTRPEPHAHLVCSRCGLVVDVEAPVDVDAAVATARAAGHEPDGAAVVLAGRCAACAGLDRVPGA